MSKTQRTTQEATPWAAVQPQLQQIAGDAKNLYESGGLNPSVYGGDRVAGINPQMQTALDAMGAGSSIPAVAQAAWERQLNPAYSQTTMDAIRDGVTGRTQQSLASMFSGGGTSNSLAAPAATDAMVRALAPLEYQFENDVAQRQMAALGMAPTIQNLGRTEMSDALTAGQILQGNEQNQINADMAKFYESANPEMQALQNYAGFINPMASMGGTSAGSETGPSAFGTAVSGGLGNLFMNGLGMLPIFSDRRLKENIKRIGTADNGLPLYLYTYKGCSIPRIGPMAQDVLEVMPEHVSQNCGHYMVDLGGVFAK
jgi:hypothetical protein